MDGEESSAVFRIGLTGGIGSGKSSAARFFQSLGVPVIDADAISHELTGPGQPAVRAISEKLGENVALDNGAMDRARVRKIVFENPDKRQILEHVLHPLIQATMRQRIEGFEYPYCILEIPLLVEGGGKHPLVDRVVVVDAPVKLRIARVQKRSGLDEDRIRSIMASQATEEQRLNAADDVIDNSGSLESLESQIAALHARYLEMAGSTPL